MITGYNSYIGRSFQGHVSHAHRVQELSVRDEGWMRHDFSRYDAVLHVAAIVHQPHQQDRDLYSRVNRDLPRAICRQAVGQGVKQFVFLSTMGVFGVAPSRGGEGKITASTECRPSSHYGESKLAAERDLQEMQREHPFALSIIRPPMVYGRGCPGNYFHRLMRMGRLLPAFPLARSNRLSMIGIGNLCELLRLIIEGESAGIYCPDDRDGFGTEQRLSAIASLHGRRIRMSRVLGLPIRWLPWKKLDSLFGDLYYSDDFNHFGNRYVIDSFRDTVRRIVLPGPQTPRSRVDRGSRC